MDIKDLNKVQLILLALLLSFVTSIATGITTVTLMQQAPASVTVPINRIVKQTVEKIVPVEGKTTVETVVIKEEDLVVEAIAQNQPAVFSVSKKVEDAIGTEVEVSAGNGFAVSEGDIVVVDKVLVPGPGTYFLENGGKFNAEFILTDPAGFSFLKIGSPLAGTAKLAYTVPSWGDITKMKRGQKILVLGAFISSFTFEGNANMKLKVDQSTAGGLVVNLEGVALGIALLNEANSFVPIQTILNSLKSI